MAGIIFGHRKNSALPATDWEAITASDSTVLDPRPRGIMVTVAGNLALESVHGNSVPFPVLASVIYPLSPSKVRSTGTTATGIIGVY